MDKSITFVLYFKIFFHLVVGIYICRSCASAGPKWIENKRMDKLVISTSSLDIVALLFPERTKAKKIECVNILLVCNHATMLPSNL